MSPRRRHEGALVSPGGAPHSTQKKQQASEHGARPCCLSCCPGSGGGLADIALRIVGLGTGATLVDSAQGCGSLLEISSGALHLEHMAISGAPFGCPSSRGAAVAVGEAAVATMHRCNFTENGRSGAGQQGLGGAIHVAEGASLSMSECRLLRNGDGARRGGALYLASGAQACRRARTHKSFSLASLSAFAAT